MLNLPGSSFSTGLERWRANDNNDLGHKQVLELPGTQALDILSVVVSICLLTGSVQSCAEVRTSPTFCAL